jgi:hypothetical protein
MPALVIDEMIYKSAHRASATPKLPAVEVGRR